MPPFQNLPVAQKPQPREIDNWTIGRMFAGNPFRIIERECAGGGWNRKLRVEDFARSLAGIDCNFDRRRVDLLSSIESGANRRAPADDGRENFFIEISSGAN